MLEFNHISKSVQKFTNIVKGRRTGEIKSLKTSSKKINLCTMDGFEWGRIVTIAGRSASGKSLWLEQLKRDFCDLNQEQDFEVLSFELEMLSTDQVARSVSGKMGVSTKYLYSGEDNKITNEEQAAIEDIAKSMNRYPIYYVDEAGTAEDIYNTALKFAEYRQLKAHNKGLVITIDHVLLTKGGQKEGEKQIIDSLCKWMIRLKKKCEAEGIDVLILLLSQLNRNIDMPERALNNKLHYPTRSDIFGASSLFFASDYVMIIHKPIGVEGITRETGYGPSNLPVFNPSNPEQPMIYIHILKDRFGDTKILQMLDNFKQSKITDYYARKST